MPKIKNDLSVKKRKVKILPSDYPCCAEGTCPQHQQAGELELATNFIIAQAVKPKYIILEDDLLESR